jgi:hypothetical protein
MLNAHNSQLGRSRLDAMPNDEDMSNVQFAGVERAAARFRGDGVVGLAT